MLNSCSFPYYVLYWDGLYDRAESVLDAISIEMYAIENVTASLGARLIM
jgi:hypothetical protein